ncbi:hypothetical protein DID88_004512 [Monilinia fructigena]|uniref:Uncharacterized protein n=1 Tax=Monilinia fructigena TaxID=38457 RepID=A0A395IWE8_9HELO|nr:hypothetical protein DID88_004512 [Monilinia fructigena]
MAAFVRVSGPPNSNFLVGYPGISATLPRIEGKVEIRPLTGISAPIAISLIEFFLIIKAHLSGARDITHRHPVTICPLDAQECKEKWTQSNKLQKMHLLWIHQTRCYRPARLLGLRMRTL